jgi:hypothetical protein
MGLALGGSAALGELGLGIAGAVSGAPASNVPLPPSLPGVGMAANSGLQGIGGLGQYNLYGPNIGQASGITQGLVNNPNAANYQSGAGIAGQMGQQAGLNAFGAGGSLYGAGNQVMQTAMDPQSALYNRTLQQLQDQVNAQNAMSGTATSPYGAGVADQAYSNFNIDWQNAQLQRQIAGLGAAGGAYGQGQGLQSAGVGEYLQGAALPYGTFNTIGGNQLGALSGLGQFGAAGQGVAQQPIQDYMNYALGAQGSNIGLGQLGLNQAQLGFGQNQTIGQGIGAGLGGLAGMGWGSQWGGGWGNSPYSPNYSQVASTPYSGLPAGGSLLNPTYG